MNNPTSYNPLDTKNLAANVARALLEQTPEALGSIKKFSGAGIYVIYYTGKFKCYARIAGKSSSGDFLAPIYVGKAIPKGGRKGGTGDAGSTLFSRLQEHAESIKQASNLDIGDFQCRYLVVDDIWIPLVESFLIARFSPVWNNFVDGFGNHDPGSGRYNGMRPRWDVLHPGRPWADRCQPRPETQAQIAAEVENLLQAVPTKSSS